MHDRRRSIALAVHLVETARLEAGRHHERVDTGFDAVREPFVEADDRGDAVRIGSLQIAQLLLERGITRSQDDELGREGGDRRRELDQQIDAFLLAQTGDYAEQGPPGLGGQSELHL